MNLFSHLLYLGGKCGVCGEAYDKPNKLFEKNGRMYLGKIVQTYKQGEEIDVKVKVSLFEIYESNINVFFYLHLVISKSSRLF